MKTNMIDRAKTARSLGACVSDVHLCRVRGLVFSFLPRVVRCQRTGLHGYHAWCLKGTTTVFLWTDRNRVSKAEHNWTQDLRRYLRLAFDTGKAD